jgi:hypothetical protein
MRPADQLLLPGRAALPFSLRYVHHWPGSHTCASTCASIRAVVHFAYLCCCCGLSSACLPACLSAARACSEEALYELLAAVEPNIVDMRVVKDKYTGAPPAPWPAQCLLAHMSRAFLLVAALLLLFMGLALSFVFHEHICISKA